MVSCPLLRQIEEIILGSRLLSYGYKATGIRGYGQLTTDNGQLTTNHPRSGTTASTLSLKYKHSLDCRRFSLSDSFC